MYNQIIAQLNALSQGNETYAAFNKRIVNTKMPVIGVRVPDLRRLARELAPDMSAADISKLLLKVQNESFDPLPGLHLRPIDPVVHWGPSTAPRGGPCGDLVLEVVSRLDAFSGYPSRTWPTSGAPGGTTGAPGVRPSRSSRTGDGSPQVSCARRG